MEGGKARSPPLLRDHGTSLSACHAMLSKCFVPWVGCELQNCSCCAAWSIIFLCMQPAYASTAVETSEDMQCMNDTARSSLSLSTNKHKHA
jgi:hypothetical protein